MALNLISAIQTVLTHMYTLYYARHVAAQTTVHLTHNGVRQGHVAFI